MTPDRIRGFLKRPPAGSLTLQLAADGLTGVTVVATWERKEVEEEEADDKRNDIAATIIAQAQEYCDGERAPIKFLIQWMSGRDKAITHTTHRVVPSPESDQDGPATSHVSDASIIKDLLCRLNDKDKILNTMIGTSTTAYDKTITMLTGQLESAYKQLNAQMSEPAALPVVMTDEQKEESIQRAAALKAFGDIVTGKVPEGIDLLFAFLANKYLPDPPTKDDGEKGATSH